MQAEVGSKVVPQALQAPIKPSLRSRAAALYEYDTGQLLYEKNGDTPIPPASMTKLMTLHLVYEAMEEGRFSPETEVVVDEEEDFRKLPRRSSLMFLQEGQSVTVRELMQGLAVSSGNDAALVLAKLTAGTVEDFVELMNKEVNEIGIEGLHFADPAGLSEENEVTAKSFGRFCIYYIRQHPESLESLHDLESFTYPKPQDVENGEPALYGSITQDNYNILVGRHPWVDGLKTGYIDESGYNIALSAKKGERRLVGVLMGGPGEDSREGSLTRAIDGVNLLSYGFYAFQRIEAEVDLPESLRVWKGRKKQITPAAVDPRPVVVPALTAAEIEVKIDIHQPIIAPIGEGDVIGSAALMHGESVLAEYPLRSSEDVPLGRWWKRVLDSILLFWYSLWN